MVLPRESHLLDGKKDKCVDNERTEQPILK